MTPVGKSRKRYGLLFLKQLLLNYFTYDILGLKHERQWGICIFSVVMFDASDFLSISDTE